MYDLIINDKDLTFFNSSFAFSDLDGNLTYVNNSFLTMWGGTMMIAKFLEKML